MELKRKCEKFSYKVFRSYWKECIYGFSIKKV